MNTHFKEEQRFTQPWLWIIIAGALIFPITILVKEINDGANWKLLFALVPIPIVILLFLSLKLKMEISDLGIKMEYPPLPIRKSINWDEIENAKVVNYGFVGGWGIRLWTKYGTVYNVSGNKGLALKLKNGKKFLIGTQRPEELKEVINRLA